MEIDVKLKDLFDIKNLCRLCLGAIDTSNVISIFNQVATDSRLPEKIEECVSIKMTNEESMPVNICFTCYKKVNEWLDFKQNAQTSDLNLRHFLSNETRLLFKDNPTKNEILDVGLQISYDGECKASELLTIKNGYTSSNYNDGTMKLESEHGNGPDGDNSSENDDEDDLPLSSMFLTVGSSKKQRKPAGSGSSKGRTPKAKPFCEDCKTKFARFSEYHSHRQEVHGEENPLEEDLKGVGVDAEAFAVYRCHICKGDFESRESLRKHCREFHNVKVIQPYVCSHCERQFPSWGLLVVHERQHTGEKPYSCDLCGKDCFISLASLKRHKLMHAKTFSCSPCGRDFNCDSALQAHIRCKHTNEKPFLCNICGRSFSLATILNAHMTSHSAERKYHCEICGFASKTSGNHHRHKARHKKGGAKTFHCESCGKAFETKLKLSSHQIIHRPVRPHVCKLCNKGFLYNNKLERHILLVHARERPYPCHLCGKKLASKFGLGIHLKTHSKTTIAAEQEPLPITMEEGAVHFVLKAEGVTFGEEIRNC